MIIINLMFTARIESIIKFISYSQSQLDNIITLQRHISSVFFSSSFKWNEKLVYSTFFVHNDARSFIRNCHDIPKYLNSGSTPIRHGGNCFKIPRFHETNGMKENSIWIRGVEKWQQAALIYT